MKVKLEEPSFAAITADLLVIGIFQDESLQSVIQEHDPNFPSDFLKELEDLCKNENFKGKSKESISIFTHKEIAARRLIIAGLGKKEEYDGNSIRRAAAACARQFAGKESYASASLFMRFEGKNHCLQAAVEGWLLGSYSFNVYKTQKESESENTHNTKILTLLDEKANKSDFETACACGRAIAESTAFARNLIAEPACIMTPSKIAEIAASLTGNYVSCEILEAEDAGRLGMGAYLSVSRGSHQPPKFVCLKYAHPESRQTFALVGKGITFDSGGLSLKTANGMETMKYDMSGAAVVLGTLRAMIELQAPVSVLAIIAACENMPGGNATKPGDVLKSMCGKTIEVNNTDAEGRLTLADALYYASQKKPDIIIDVATLTGAVVSALGRAAAGIMGNNQKLIQQIQESGNKAGEKLWQLPLYEDYKESLKSDIADLKNAGSRGEAGASCAGLFLKEFVGESPWAHLDIAGVGWRDKEKEELNKGGTAFGVRTLCYFLLARAEEQLAKEA